MQLFATMLWPLNDVNPLSVFIPSVAALVQETHDPKSSTGLEAKRTFEDKNGQQL